MLTIHDSIWCLRFERHNEPESKPDRLTGGRRLTNVDLWSGINNLAMRPEPVVIGHLGSARSGGSQIPMIHVVHVIGHVLDSLVFALGFATAKQAR